jgi:peptide deformylase
MSLQIVHYNNPILRKKGNKVTVFDAALAEFARQMIAAMHAAEGIGLAAQQVGRAIQLCVLDLRGTEAEFAGELDGGHPPRDLYMPMVLVNPELTIPSRPAEEDCEEGCLSFPGIRGEVKRPLAITVDFQDERGAAHHLVCDGLLARCIQHEIDHLHGILFIDRMKKKLRGELDESIRALSKKTRDLA